MVSLAVLEFSLTASAKKREAVEEPGWEKMLSTDDGELRFQPVGFTHQETLGSSEVPIEPKNGYHFRGIWIEASLKPSEDGESSLSEYSILPSYTRSIDGTKLNTYEKHFYSDYLCGSITIIKSRCMVIAEVPDEQEEIRLILQIRRNKTEPIERIGIWRLSLESQFRLQYTELVMSKDLTNWPHRISPTCDDDPCSLENLLNSEIIALVEIEEKLDGSKASLAPYVDHSQHRERLRAYSIPGLIDFIWFPRSVYPIYRVAVLDTYQGKSIEHIILIHIRRLEPLDPLEPLVPGERLLLFLDQYHLDDGSSANRTVVHQITEEYGTFEVDGQRAYPRYPLRSHEEFDFYHHQNLQDPYFELPELLDYITG